MTDIRTDDPATIEAEIRQTQDNMSRTVEKIGSQLTPKNLFNALLDKADDNDIDARLLLDGARRNPLALGLIAAGAIWLISENDAKLPAMPRLGRKAATPKADADGADTPDRMSETSDHRGYVSHMSAVDQRDDEDEASYQRRRDIARSNFFMVERNENEEESTFRKRLDAMTDTLRRKRNDLSAKSGETRAAVVLKAQQAAEATRAGYVDNPLVGGIVAAALGAAIGGGMPLTRQEQRRLSGMGGKAREFVDSHKDQLASQLRDKKDQLVEQADTAISKPNSGGEGEMENHAEMTMPTTTQA